MGKDMTRAEALKHCTSNEVAKVLTAAFSAGMLAGANGGGIPGFIGGSSAGVVTFSAAAPAFHKRCMQDNGGHAPAEDVGEAFSVGVTCTIL